jgi:nucleotide-binding universal stress UspA family protein
MERKIIIGYHPEHGGFDAVQLGLLFAEVLSAKPIVVTALPWPDYLAPPKEMQKQLDTDMAPEFSALSDRFPELDAETRAIACRSGARALHEVADSERAELIVIGSSHRGPVGRTFVAGVGESLMHGAPCALTIAPRGYAERDRLRCERLAVAFDGSPESWSALETAIALAERLGGDLTILTVADYLSYGYTTTWTILTAGELEDAERREKHRLLETALGRVPDDLPSDGRVLVGSAGITLAEASAEFDLIVSGSRGYGPLRRTLLGSTTRTLIAGSNCPVLVLPRAVGADPLGIRNHRTSELSSKDRAPGRR